jgi:serine O-acetyltransferase
MLKNDIRKTYDLVTGGKVRKIVGCYRSPGVHAVTTYRFGQWLSKQNIGFRILLTPIYLFQYHRMRSKWGIEIPRATKIDEGLYVGHSGGISISHAAVIGKNLRISQQVTIGVSGEGEKRGCPVIGDDVYIGPGAKIFGKITIGNNVKIGANAVIHKDIPDNAVVVLEPGYKIIRIQLPL